MKAIYVEAFCGISGNMFLGGLLNLGVPDEYITDEIAKLIVQDADEKEFIGKDEVQAKEIERNK